MGIGRREFVAGMACAGVGLAAGQARAEAFPARDISLIIPYGPGGGSDKYARAVIPSLQAQLGGGIQVLPVNVDGAGGARGVNQLFHAKPDGYTIGITGVPGIVTMQETGGLAFDVHKLTWLGNMGKDRYGMVVPVDSPLKSVADMQALAKKRAIKFTCGGTAGTAYGATRIGSALLGMDCTVITGYRGTNDYVVAAVRGDGDAAVASLVALDPFIKSKMVRVLCTFEEHSSYEGAEDATTLAKPELLKIMELRPLAAPPGLSAETTARLSTALVAALNDPKIVAWAKANSANMSPDDAATTRKMIDEQFTFIDKWKSYIK